MAHIDTPVLVVGGGPVGLMLSIELASRAVPNMLVNTGETTAAHPQGNTHNCRTMEHYRRHGIGDSVRIVGLPHEDVTDVMCCTRLNGIELSRIPMPSSADKVRRIIERDPTFLTPEPIHRASQLYVEPVLKKHAQEQKEIHLKYGWKLICFRQKKDHVIAEIEKVSSGQVQKVRCRWLAGCDGAQGFVRRELGIKYLGEGGEEIAFMIGRMISVYIDAPGIYDVMPNNRAWQIWTINEDSRACFVSLDGRGKFVVLAKHPAGNKREEGVSDNKVYSKMVRALINAAIGTQIDFKIISVKDWTAGNALVAERYQSKNVFLAGDSAHLFTPTGGFGMNTGIDDAVNLGWKMAAVYQGWAPEKLLDTYDVERRPIGIRNTQASRKLASDVATIEIPPVLEDSTPEGAQQRVILGEHLAGFTEEFASLGIQLGVRYDTSPLIISDGSTAPLDSAVDYVPSGSPGGRAPHTWLEDGASILDKFGQWFTLLKFGLDDIDTTPFQNMAQTLNIPLTVVQISEPNAQKLYGCGLVLVRPDGHVAWRGNTLPNVLKGLLRTVSGHTVHEINRSDRNDH